MTPPAITAPAPETHVFLLLQGPHGPFFFRLGQALRRTGVQVWRVGFNAGDRAFWWEARSYIPYRAPLEAWGDRFDALVRDKGVTDIVLYGDTRAIHATAIARAKAHGVTVHVFEEGYLRPYWVSYERGGSNGHSRLMDMTVAQMRAALEDVGTDAPMPPAHWGDLRHHIFHGALYHWCVLCWNRRYRGYRPHRALTVGQEFRLYLRRLLLMPAHALDRWLATRRIRNGGFPYHVALLQLEHDSSFQTHGPFATMAAFLEVVIRGFAEGAPRHHHLVFKAHPLEDGRAPLRRDIRRLAREAGVAGRVHYLRGGKLADLLNGARTAVTVNSTAAHQVLWRGLPLKALGAAIYAKPEFVSDQPLPDFFARPKPPDRRAYAVFRGYLLKTSQVPGSFYSGHGRRQVLRRIVDMMLAPEGPHGRPTSCQRFSPPADPPLGM